MAPAAHSVKACDPDGVVIALRGPRSGARPSNDFFHSALFREPDHGCRVLAIGRRAFPSSPLQRSLWRSICL